MMEKLRVPYRDGPPMSVADRKKWLLRLMEMLTKHEADLCEALYRDLHKCKQEALMCDVLSVKSEISMILSNLEYWAAGETIPRTFVSLLDTCRVQPQPFGKVLILAPWNYPLFLLLIPLAGAIAAGNVVVCKPSELAPATERLLTLLLPKFLDETICHVFNGGAEDTQELLNTTHFDFIFFTGSSNVGRMVMQAAAKNLTPVALELGGKCPVYLDESANLTVAAKRIMSGKILNAGQTCVAPDYVLCHRRVLNAFVEECHAVLNKFLGEDPKESPDYARIINEKNTERLARLLKQTEGEKVIGGTFDIVEKFVAPTIVTNVQPEDVLMKDEIFGPILPIVTVDSCDDAIRFVTSMERPLAVYVFTKDKNQYNSWSDLTSSGAIIFNECVLQMSVSNLPFGGVGNSGFGRYRGKANFDVFSNPRSYVDRSQSEIANEKFRYPPYTDNTESWVRWLLKTREDSNCCIS
uniref:Aldehyde dehydrogenase n=1 Tax=Schistocephalus solidus TaxID=70667 RepID=A0A0X3P8Q0_SCHSO